MACNCTEDVTGGLGCGLAAGIVIFLFCIGVGGCELMIRLGNAKVEAAKRIPVEETRPHGN